MEELKGIRPLEPIDDISMYLFAVLLTFMILIIGSLLYLLFRTIKRRRDESLRKKVLERLKAIEFDDPKEAAYRISKYARFLATDERSQKMLEQLLPHLEKYKFVKDPPVFDELSVQYYHLFLKSVDAA